MVVARAGRRVEVACDEERNRRHCREGTWVSWKALSNALDGASDRDMLFVVRGGAAGEDRFAEQKSND